MNKIYLVYFLLIISCSSKEGPIYLKKYSNGKLIEEGSYKNDSLRIGTHKQYFLNGNIKSLTNYNSFGILDGESLLYFEDGGLWQKRKYLNDYLEGPVIEYYQSQKVKSKANFYKSIIVGNVYHYYPNGKIKSFNFRDFNNNNRIVVNYDENSQVTSALNIGEFLFDSVLKSDIVKPPYNLPILINVASLPQANVLVEVNQLNITNQIKKIASYKNVDTLILLNVPITDSVKLIKITGVLTSLIDNTRKTIISEIVIRDTM